MLSQPLTNDAAQPHLGERPLQAAIDAVLREKGTGRGLQRRDMIPVAE